MEIGVLTYHRSHNYGSYLQAYALVSRLKKEGYHAELIDYNMDIAAEAFGKPHLGKNIFRYYKQLRQFNLFNQSVKYLPLSSVKIQDKCGEKLKEEIYKKYDLIIAGGDEIWRIDGFRGFPTPYWLPNDYGSKKASYAVSCRSDLDKLSQSEIEEMKEYLEQFEYISVRDVETKQQIKQITDNKKNVHLVCDPVFLWDFKGNVEKGEKIFQEHGIRSELPKIAFMNGDRQLAIELKKRFHKKAIVISIYEYIRGLENIIDLTPFEWIDIIAASRIVVTSYFHGTCFSLINGTPFISLDCSREGEGKSKIFDLLNRSGLSEHYVLRSNKRYVDEVISKCMEQFEIKYKTDYNSNIKNLYEETESFFDFLKNEALISNKNV